VAPGVELVAAPWTSKRPLADMVGQVVTPLVADGTVRIVVGHGAVDTLSPDRHNPALIAVEALDAALADGRIHYVALGDRHSTTQVGASGRIWYSGAPEMTDFDEIDAGNALVVEVDGADTGAGGRVDVTAHRVGRWAFHRRSFTVDGPDDLDALGAWLDGLPAKNEAIVRLDLTGTLSLREQARLDALLAHATDLFAALDVWDEAGGVTLAPDQEDQFALGLTGFARRALEHLETEAAGPHPDAAAEAQDALALLFRLARGAA
jgi:DNA repair exonuclease SbcCD nuclease subunit